MVRGSVKDGRGSEVVCRPMMIFVRSEVRVPAARNEIRDASNNWIHINYTRNTFTVVFTHVQRLIFKLANKTQEGA